MGIILDSHKMEARLPVDKVERIKTALCEFRSKPSTTLQELQSLIGTLNFACKVIAPGRPFLQRMIALTRDVKKPHHHIKLTTGFFQRPRACLLSSGMVSGCSYLPFGIPLRRSPYSQMPLAPSGMGDSLKLVGFRAIGYPINS